MIVYNSRSWTGPLTHYRGTVFPHLSAPLLLIGVWAYVVFHLQDTIELTNFKVGPALGISGSFTSFFLIFRTNQSYRRYWISTDCLKEIQVAVRELHRQFLVYIKGGILLRGKGSPLEAEWEMAANTAKTDATRYCAAYCVAFKLHTRLAFDGYMLGEVSEDCMMQVNFDRARLRGLLSHEEFSVVDAMLRVEPVPSWRCTLRGWKWFWRISQQPCARACHIIIFFLRCLACQCCHAKDEWGWLERCLNLSDVMIGHLMRAFEAMDQSMTTPLPLPYSHLMKVMMFLFVFMLPVVGVSNEAGPLVKTIVTVSLTLAMFGLEVVSMEIEHPFGEALNDFDTMHVIAAIEGSLFDIVVCRNDPCQANFTWLLPPQEYRMCSRFLCLCTSVNDVMQMMPGCRLDPDCEFASLLAGRVSDTEHRKSQEFYTKVHMHNETMFQRMFVRKKPTQFMNNLPDSTFLEGNHVVRAPSRALPSSSSEGTYEQAKRRFPNGGPVNGRHIA